MKDCCRVAQDTGDEIAAALGRAGMDDELARDVIERPQHRDLLGLSWCRHTKIRPRLRPMRGQDRDASTPRSRRHKEERCPRLRPAVCATAGAGRPVRLSLAIWRPFSVVPQVAANGTFFRNASTRCERLMREHPHALRSRRAVEGSSSCAGRPPVAPATASPPGNAAFTLHRHRAGRPRSLSVPQYHRRRSHCAKAELYPQLRHTERLGDVRIWSSRPASAARRVLCPLRRDRVSRPAS